MATNGQLFSADDSVRPLADRMRPTTLAEFSGQSHLLSSDSTLRQALEHNRLHSMIFWGPPGTGKTTLARMIASHCDAHFMSLSAVLSGVKDIREKVSEARDRLDTQGQRSVLFVDEVHRFNKSQQDAFLPHVEDGTLYFVGATTENPSFELNNALLSRVRVYVLKHLENSDIRTVIDHALSDANRGLGAMDIQMDDEYRDLLAATADGDARHALVLLELASDCARREGDTRIIDEAVIREVTRDSFRQFDKGGDHFYDQISALHKSVRGSNPDAALYWFTRMLDGGADPRYLSRRIVRMAWEDIGLADPRAMQIANDAASTFERLGSPEGELALGQAVIYLAVAAKSNAGYNAYNQAKAFVKQDKSREVPVHLRNAPTKLMKELGHGHDYRYAHDEPDAYAAGETYLPEGVGDLNWYEPVPRGLEIKIAEKLRFLRQLDDQAVKEGGKSTGGRRDG